MRLSLPSLLFSCTAVLLLAGCGRHIRVPRTTPQYGLQVRVSLPAIAPGAELENVRATVELINDNDLPYTVSDPAQTQACLPVVWVDGQARPWELHMRRVKDARVTVPAHGRITRTYELPLSRYAGATRPNSAADYQLQLFYHPRIYSPAGSFARTIEIPSNKHRF
ncbi:hypothetical protein GCM10027048_16080 [Hymenobacter coalescens]